MSDVVVDADGINLGLVFLVCGIGVISTELGVVGCGGEIGNWMRVSRVARLLVEKLSVSGFLGGLDEAGRGKVVCYVILFVKHGLYNANVAITTEEVKNQTAS